MASGIVKNLLSAPNASKRIITISLIWLVSITGIPLVHLGLKHNTVEQDWHPLSRDAHDLVISQKPCLNINSSSTEDLIELPGIGPVLASRIISFREARGDFRSLVQLDEVKGLGPKKIEKMKAEICPFS